MFEWIESNPETCVLLIASIANCIFTVLGYKRTGVLKYLGSFDQSVLRQAETTKQADIVNQDLDKLIEYHTKTANELSKLKSQTEAKNGKS